MAEDKNKDSNNESAQEGEPKKEEEQINGQKEEENQATAAPPKEMRAIVLNGFGGLKSLKVGKRSEPTVEKDKVLIRIKACGVNFLDVLVRQGVVNNLPKTPFILGFECAGEIEAVGEEVSDFKVGDQVAALTESNSFAELISVSSSNVYKIPSGISHKDVAGMLMNYVLAYILMYDLSNLKDGKVALVHSAGGAVGLAIAQLTKLIAPEAILIGIASKHKHEHIKDYYTHLIEHGSDYVQEVKKISSDGVDLVLDCSSGDDANKGNLLLKPLGKYIMYGTSSIVSGETKSFFSVARSWWQVDKVNPLKLYDENKCICGFNLRNFMFKHQGLDYVREVVDKVFKLLQDEKITPIIDSTYAFEDIGEAMQKLHDRKNIGKIVLDPSMEPKPKPLPEKKSKKTDKEAKQAPSQEETKSDDAVADETKESQTAETDKSKEDATAGGEEKKD